MTSETSKLERLRTRNDLFSVISRGPLGLLSSLGGRWLLPPVMGLAATSAVPAQDALRASLAGDAAVEAQQAKFQSMNYAIKTDDFMLQVTPSMGFDWNDNVNLSKAAPESDFILTPLIGLDTGYLFGNENRLNLSVDGGYRKYFQHDEFSQWYLGSASVLSFDIYIKDFQINLHDRFQCSEDSAQQAAVSGTGNYGSFVNTAGLAGTWDLDRYILTLGYDHQDTESISGQFNQINGASEMIVARAAVQVHPKLAVGPEGSAAFMSYDEAVLNNYQTYSAGIFAEWRSGSYLTVKPRAGYVLFNSSQTSATIRGQNLTSWYADLTLAHQITDVLNYSFSAGREIEPGIESDAIEDYYVRPTVNWALTRTVTLQPSLFYEHGAEAAGQAASQHESSFDWYGGALSLAYSPTKSIRASLSYRLTLRSSNVGSGEYTQNLVGLQFSYTPQ
jgi:hypothetical protein